MMEMEVVMPRASMDFDFSSSNPSAAYLSCPSTPKRFGNYYFSAPTSPSRLSEFCRDFDDFSMKSSGVPFDWEEKPGTPKSSSRVTVNNDDDFAFDFSEELERASLSAEELFDGGKIRPLKPPPGLQINAGVDKFSTRKKPVLSPVPHGKDIMRETSYPRKKKNVDTAANTPKRTEYERGRERGLGSSRRTRSLSPLRVSELAWEEEEQQMNKQSSSKPTPPSSSSSSSKGSKKWRLKDFLLFRSASEGRATDKDPFRKYVGLFGKQEDVKNESFRSTGSSGSVSKRRGAVSAHELHYTVNRAVSENLKKKTFLPYKQGILGRLAFNPALHALANGFGSLTRG